MLIAHTTLEDMKKTPSQIDFGMTILGLQKDRKRLVQEKAAIERRIEVIDRTVESLIFLGNPSSKMPLPARPNEMGLQEAVRSILRRAFPVPMLPTEVRDTLVSAGAFGPTSRNLLIAIHTAISRIKDQLEEVPQPEGKKAYRWRIDEVPAPDIGIVTGSSIDRF